MLPYIERISIRARAINKLCLNFTLLRFLHLLLPAMKLRQGKFFTRVCDSVHRGVSLRQPLDRDPWTETSLDRDYPDRDPPGQIPPGQRPPDRDPLPTP